MSAKLAGLLARLRRRQAGLSIYPSRRLEPGPMSPAPSVPADIPRPPYAAADLPPRRSACGAVPAPPSPARAPGVSGAPEIFDTPEGLARMRAAGAVAAAALSLAGRMIEAWPAEQAASKSAGAVAGGGAPQAAAPAPPLTTDAVDRAVHAFLVSRGAYPSPLGYHGFPRSVCVAVNECAAHGVPDGAPLRAGDLVTVDVTAFKGGVHGDTNATFFVGGAAAGGGGAPVGGAAAASARRPEPAPAAAPAAIELVEATRAALEAAIARCGPGVPFSEVGRTIQRVADASGLSVVRELVGHGIGRTFHAPPAVRHYRQWGSGGGGGGGGGGGWRMALGQAFTIEPILALGGRRLAAPWRRDGWTVLMADGALAAQFEHTLVIGADGAEVVTRAPPQS
jgi:methionyl aminopeptidase